MTAEILNLLTLFLLGIAYLVIMSKFNIILTGKYMQEKNTAGYLLYAAVLIASAIYLVQTADIASESNRFFMRKGMYSSALLFSGIFFILSFLCSMILTMSSFFVSSMLTIKSEKEELANNNIELAIMHAVILISLALITHQGFATILTSYIPFPEMPY
jgi:hypothetical protein